MSDERTEKIKQLNDIFRQTGIGGMIVATQGIRQLPDADQQAIFSLVQNFKAFTSGDDPYGEHDFGKVTYKEHGVFFKIDYYDKDMQDGSEDPADPQQTTRVMTIMLTNEY